MSRYFAHSLAERPIAEWQPLETHLRNVAALAGGFARPFEAADWGYAAGLLHDIGKYSHEFQDMLIRSAETDINAEAPGRLDHSSAGAQTIDRLLPGGLGKLLAYAVAGHHSGLLDGISNDACLRKRLQKEVADYSACPSSILDNIPALQVPPILREKTSLDAASFRLQFFVRMIFSCLVDADRLDTEAFCDIKRAEARARAVPLDALRNKLAADLSNLRRISEETPVNMKRGEILERCLYAAEWNPGVFSLTVPTGGGKTRSSLAFALSHAIKHGMKRIIYVIPYTNIIEQNAKVFRDICGDEAVLEHHSNFESKEDPYRAQLAAENWDAPLIVTTNVQFFETLYNHRVSKCRKAHNIANSVVIFDEAQMIPVDLLRPCMAAIEELVRAYRVTAVLCSATQPALEKSEAFKCGIANVREIIEKPIELYNFLRRVKLNKLPRLGESELAKRVGRHKRALCIVNTRKHARCLFRAIAAKEGLYHLSGLMCPAHRSYVLAEIREALKSGAVCRVVSTQLVEAGVDIDFPVVYRELAGVDSIAQAAGRCNREGLIKAGGEVFVFEPEDAAPSGFLRYSAEEALAVFRKYEDILSLDAVREYFKNIYWRRDNLDRTGVLSSLAADAGTLDFRFESIGREFRMIQDGTRSIVVPFDSIARDLIEQLSAVDSMGIARKLQRYCIQVYPNVIEKLGRVALEPVHERYFVLRNDELYKKDIGLDWDDPYFRSIEGSIV